MAHAYTTSRGKNKQAKLNKRMDNQQNQERKLKKTSDPGFVAKEKVTFTVGHIGNSTINNRVENSDSSQRREVKLIAEKCSFSMCKSNSKKLLLCTGCRQVKYCCTDCQTKDWSTHKAACLEHKKKAKNNTNVQSEKVSNEEEQNKNNENNSSDDDSDDDNVDDNLNNAKNDNNDNSNDDGNDEDETK